MNLKMVLIVILKFLTSKHYMIFYFWYFFIFTNHITDFVFTSFEDIAEHRNWAAAACATRRSSSMDSSLDLHRSSAMQSTNTEPKGSAWPKKDYLIIYKLGVFWVFVFESAYGFVFLCSWVMLQTSMPVQCASFPRDPTLIKILFLAHFESYWFSCFIPLKFTFLVLRTWICVNVSNRKAMTLSLATNGWLGVEDNSRMCRDAEAELLELLGHQQSETGLSYL